MPEQDCIFCQIIREEIPAQPLYQDDECLIIPDIKPDAPVHWLAVPKKHIVSPMEADSEIIGYLAKKATDLAVQKGFANQGFRLIINSGPDGGQEIAHLHLHLLAGEYIGPLRSKAR